MAYTCIAFQFTNSELENVVFDVFVRNYLF
jgi:hypothetical protein